MKHRDITHSRTTDPGRHVLSAFGTGNRRGYTRGTPRFSLLVCGLLFLLSGVSGGAAEPPKTEPRDRKPTPRQWFRTAGQKKFDGLTDLVKLNKRIKVVKPKKRQGPLRTRVRLATAKKVWSCQNCPWIRKTEELSKESDRKLDAGEFRCPECGSQDVKLIPQTAAALQFQSLSKNLIPNHSFERGRWWPYKWEPVDGLGSFWVKGGTDGNRCMKFNTNVLESQWLPHNSSVITNIRKLQEQTHGRAQHRKKNPLPQPPKRKPTSPPYYDTVGGLHGIHYKGPYIPVEPGAIYRVTVDAKVEPKGGAKVFVKGFIDLPYKTREGPRILKRNAYRAPMDLKGLSTEWKRFSRLLHPAHSKSSIDAKPVQPEWLQVQLYSYWPPGTYWWDNVKLEIIGYEKVRGPDGEIPQETETEDAKGMQDGFPVF